MARKSRSGPEKASFPAIALMLAFAAIGGLAGCGAKMADDGPQAGTSAASGDGGSTGDSSAGGDSSKKGKAVPVRITHPKRGGLPRTTSQPASVHAFESADLYADISGFLKDQKVDIGDRVEQGQILAEIYAPELVRQVDADEATLRKSQAQVTVAEAALDSAKADLKAAQDRVVQAKSDLDAAVATVAFREKQYARTKKLVEEKAVIPELLDEREEARKAAQAERISKEKAISVAQSQQRAAEAKVQQAAADVQDAQAAVEVAKAQLAKSQVFVEYTRILSPYDGVVTLRGFHRGDYITPPDKQGTNPPILAVGRTDLMRVIMQVPDKDVPYVDRGDSVTLVIDALPGRTFHGKVARMAAHEDYKTRTMRTEADFENPDGALKDGMYGRMTIALGRPEHGVNVPSRALSGSSESKKRSVYVVRDGKAQRVDVEVAEDNGRRAEVVSGLSADDQVIVEHGPDLADGIPVRVLGTAKEKGEKAESQEKGQGKSKMGQGGTTKEGGRTKSGSQGTNGRGKDGKSESKDGKSESKSKVKGQS